MEQIESGEEATISELRDIAYAAYLQYNSNDIEESGFVIQLRPHPVFYSIKPHYYEYE